MNKFISYVPLLPTFRLFFYDEPMPMKVLSKQIFILWVLESFIICAIFKIFEI